MMATDTRTITADRQKAITLLGLEALETSYKMTQSRNKQNSILYDTYQNLIEEIAAAKRAIGK